MTTRLRADVVSPKREAASLERALRVTSRAQDLLTMLTQLADLLPDLLPSGVSDRVSLALVSPTGETLRVCRLLPRLTEIPEEWPQVRAQGTAVAAVALDGQPRVIADVRGDDNLRFGRAAHDGIRSTASVPVRVAGRVVGVLNVGSRHVGGCTTAMIPELLDLATLLGPHLVLALRSGDVAPLVKSPEPVAHDDVVARDPAMQALLRQAQRAARSDAAVLLTGETGVGKSLIAKKIHAWSPRASAMFATVHLADLPATLVESELFGHERGAFTGAEQRRVGRFELASGGTIFLDEIAEAPLPVQAKLLRVTQDRQFERVGGTATLRSDIRLIAATHCDLHAAAAAGLFRRDLLYRLEVLTLHVPALRERPADLEPLTASILARLGQSTGRSLRLTDGAWQRLRAYPWPGNVRELDNVLTRAALLEDDDALELRSLPGHLAPQPEVLADWPTRDAHERDYLLRVLTHTAHRIEGQQGAAELLGMTPSTLRSRLDKLGVVWRTAAGKRSTGGQR